MGRIESPHSGQNQISLQLNSKAGIGWRFHCDCSSTAGLCHLWANTRRSSPDGKGCHNWIHRKPEEAQRANPERRRNSGDLLGSRVCLGFRPLGRVKSFVWNGMVSFWITRREPLHPLPSKRATPRRCTKAQPRYTKRHADVSAQRSRF